ncbi:MAG: hypothetical protein LBK59_11120, partial [Bifidobacteriaceae bacterium]|nr:hypothetical protein [Bifidobacteriaceae bacterium]
MIIVDTSVWIDHLHRTEPDLKAALGSDGVTIHPLVIEELAAGSLADRAEVLWLLGRLPTCLVMSHDEAMVMIDRWHLWSRGLSAVDIHLLGSALLG